MAEVLGELEPHKVLKGVTAPVDARTARPATCRSTACSWRSATSPNTKVFEGQLAMTPEGYLLNRTALAWDGVEAAR